MKKARVLSTTAVAVFLFCSLTSLGAQIWESEVPVTTDAIANYTCINTAWAVAASGDSVHVAWWNFDDAEIAYNRTEDYGFTWGTEVVIDTGDGEPAVAASGSNVHVVWPRDTASGGNYDIFYSRSTDNGTTFSDGLNLSGVVSGGSSATYPSIAVSGNNVHAVWIVDGKDLYYARSSDNGGAWWDTLLVADSAADASIAVSGSNVHVAWTNPLIEIRYNHSANNGTTWGAQARVDHSTTAAYAPSIAAEDDSVHLVWMDDRDGGSSIIYYNQSLDNGATWQGTDTRLVDGAVTDPTSLPSVAVSGSDVYTTWIDTRGTPQAIYFDHSADNGATWMADENLTGAALDPYNPSLAVWGTNLHVVWYDEAGADPEVYYKHAGEAQPDNHVMAEADTGYVGNDIYNSDGTDQTAQSYINAGDTAIFFVRIENDGDVVDLLEVTGDSSSAGWTVSYFDELTGGNDVTVDVVNLGWPTGDLAPGDTALLRVEVVTDTGLANGEEKNILVTSTSLADPAKLDAVLAYTRIGLPGQVDAHVKNAADAVYLGDDIYNLDGTDQTAVQSIYAGDTAFYHVQVQNDADVPEEIVIKGPAGGTGWLVYYYDALAGGTDITPAIITMGWPIGPLPSGGTSAIRVEVVPTTASAGSSYDALIEASYVSDTTIKDVVGVSTTLSPGVAEDKPVLDFSLSSPSVLSSSVTINYSVPYTVALHLGVYDGSGRLVRSLASGRHQAGTHSLTWDGSDDGGQALPRGVYFIRLDSKAGFERTKIIVLD